MKIKKPLRTDFVNKLSQYVELLLQKSRLISVSLSINKDKTHNKTNQNMLIYLYNFIIFTPSNKTF